MKDKKSLELPFFVTCVTELCFDDLSSEQKSLLTTSIHNAKISARLRNILAGANCTMIGDSLPLSPHDFLQLENSGIKTLEELINLLKSVNLELETKIEKFNTIKNTCLKRLSKKYLFNDFSDSQKKLLCSKVCEVNLSTRLLNNLAELDITYIGDILKLSDSELLSRKSFGKSSLNALQALISKENLSLNTYIEDWSSILASEFRSKYHNYSYLTVSNETFIEMQLLSLARPFCNQRNLEIVISYMGWDGTGKKTLQEVGDLFNITRERVRQIVEKFSTKVKSSNLKLPFCEKIIDTMSTVMPMSANDFALHMVNCGFSKQPFSHEGIERYLNLVGIESPWKTFSLNNETYLSLDQINEKFINDIDKYIRKRVNKFGAFNIQNLEKTLENEGVPIKIKNVIIQAIKLNKNFFWLDENKTYFGWRNINPYRCRCINRIQKVFSIVNEISVGQLRSAINKSRKMDGFHISKNELVAVCCGYGIATLKGDDKLVPLTKPNPDFVLSRSERAIVCALRQLENPTHVQPLYDLCTKLKVEHVNFGVLLSSSPVIVRLKQGIYQLIGQPIPVGIVDDLHDLHYKNRRPFLLDSGRGVKGQIWAAYLINKNCLRTGVLTMPSSFKHLLGDKNWKLMLPDTNLCNIGSNKAQIYGFKKLFEVSEISDGDCLIIEFMSRDSIKARITDYSGYLSLTCSDSEITL